MLLTVAVTLLGGLGAGLARLGWPMDALSRNWILVHGPLMIGGFLGTLICLERAVALAPRYGWALAVPVVNALGALALLLARDAIPARLLITLGSAGLVLLFGLMLRLHPSRDIAIMALGALCWLVGNALWLGGRPIFSVVHLWVAFLILTIVGERLELSRVRRLTPLSVRLLVLATGVYLLGVLLTVADLGAGIRLSGGGAVLMAAWLLRYDIARQTIRQTGLPRYVAACLLVGYVWLGFGGLIALWQGAVYAGPAYATLLHAYLLGFVFSMIFGHAPIILPAITGLKIAYTPLFYAPLVVLHVTLAYRMYGNLAGNMAARQAGALWNALAIVLFLALMAVVIRRSNRPA